EGYQVKFGPVFLTPHEEFELFQVYNPGLTEDKELTEFHAKIPIESHHWALRKITDAGVTAFGPAPVDGANFNAQILTFQHTKFMAIWQFSDDLLLPEGTAHYQDAGESLLLNLHMKNYSGTMSVPATAYLNIYTQPRGSSIEMKTDLSSYGGQNPFALQIPGDGQPVTFENVATAPGETRYFWNIQSHTHSRGKDFDMFLRNSDGTKGTQIYEGFYNEDYTFNQGYYDYTHPAVRTFNPMLEVDMTNGLIFEATYLNNTGATIPFGLTTDGEMFVTYFSYTSELPATTSVKNEKDDKSLLRINPNPAKNNFEINYTLTANDMVTIDLYNIAGVKVKNIFNGKQDEGKQTLRVNAMDENLSAGLYFVHLQANGSTTVKKIVVMN
ncbi:MAG TPA: T9SS type A sorting domain-containing protein, partial [Chitinophagales bacterium]|nr:T9SS type A sorting domain-containing protein [Chitinophagales bacterium]